MPSFPEPTHSESGGRTLFCETKRWVSLGELLAELPPPSEVTRPRDDLAALLSQVQPGSGIKSAGIKEANRPGGHWGYRQDGFVADLSKPARTVRAAATPDWIRLPDGGHRRLTWAECAALQCFPKGWQFEGALTSKFVQIGNAVPSLLAEALGRSIREALKRYRSQPRAKSAPLPALFVENIEETLREHACNAEVREAAKAAKAVGA